MPGQNTNAGNLPRYVKVVATVETQQLKVVADWLAGYFGFDIVIDWIKRDWSGGKVYCRREQEEILLLGFPKPRACESSVTILLEQIDPIAERLTEDSIEYFFSRDIGERPAIHFAENSPFFSFSIEEVQS